jgi:peptide/nickel transport system substrate-binding protein
VVLLSAVSCARSQPADPRIITIGIPSSPDNLDPRIGTDENSQRLHQLLFDPLLTIDDRLRVAPALATHWETPDDRTYVLHLRRGVRFHDGRELTSRDVVYTFASFLDPSFVSARKGAYRMLASVRALDRYTVEFSLTEAFGSFLVNLANVGIVADGSKPRATLTPTGTGPYELTRFSVDDRIELKPFARYYQRPPQNGGLVLRVIPDDTMRGLELRKGTLDLIVNDLAPDIVHQLAEEPKLQVMRAPGIDYAYLGLNLQDPALRDTRVRHALGYAINRGAIVKYLRRDLAIPAVGVLPPMSWAFEPAVFDFTFDPVRARRILDEAGFPDPDGSGPLPRLTLSLKGSSNEFSRLQSAVIQQDLAQVGVAVDVRTYEFATLYADVLRGNFQMFYLQWVGVTDPDMLRRVFHSQQIPPSGFNRGYFRDGVVDRLIDEATTSTDETARRRLYSEVQQRVAEAAPYISLWYKTNALVAQRSLRGLRIAPNAEFTFLKDVWRAVPDPSRQAAR